MDTASSTTPWSHSGQNQRNNTKTAPSVVSLPVSPVTPETPTRISLLPPREINYSFRNTTAMETATTKHNNRTKQIKNTYSYVLLIFIVVIRTDQKRIEKRGLSLKNKNQQKQLFVLLLHILFILPQCSLVLRKGRLSFRGAHHPQPGRIMILRPDKSNSPSREIGLPGTLYC